MPHPVEVKHGHKGVDMVRVVLQQRCDVGGIVRGLTVLKGHLRSVQGLRFQGVHDGMHIKSGKIKQLVLPAVNVSFIESTQAGREAYGC